jgi:hypothetical protein
MTEPEVFVLADQTLNDVVNHIEDAQWEMKVPPSFVRRATDTTPTLREIVNYHAYDDAWVPEMLAGRTLDEAGREKFKGDLLGDDPRRNFGDIVEKAVAAATQLDDLERTVHTTFGDFKAREYLWQANQFRGLRAHDIAGLIGYKLVMPDALVQGIWDEISPYVEQWRGYGVFPPAVPVPEDARLLERLLGITGRDPGGL